MKSTILGVLMAGCATARPSPLQPSLIRVQMDVLGPLLTGTTRVRPNSQAAATMTDGDLSPAEVEFCIDETGKVFMVQLARSSDNMSYDSQLERAVREWSFTPYRIGGAATRVCSAAAFRQGSLKMIHHLPG